MPKSAVRALFTAVLLGLTVIASAVVLSGPSASASATANFTAAATRPCGRKHYPPCPPKPSISVSPSHVRRGHSLYVLVRHYPAGTRVTVHLAGHGRYVFLGSATTNRRGNAEVIGTIPRDIPLGRYTVYVQVGSTTRSFHITVIRG